jgi:hypothetical protein
MLSICISKIGKKVSHCMYTSVFVISCTPAALQRPGVYVPARQFAALAIKPGFERQAVIRQ